VQHTCSLAIIPRVLGGSIYMSAYMLRCGRYGCWFVSTISGTCMIPGFRLAAQHFLANSCGFAHETMGSFASALHHVGGTHICCLKRQWLAGNHGFSVKASQPHEHGCLHKNRPKKATSLCRFHVHNSSHTGAFATIFKNCISHAHDYEAATVLESKQ
jgi:hypothetical protein